MAKKRKVRVQFRKNRENSPVRLDLTRQVQQDAEAAADLPADERVSGKGKLSRYRTIVTDDDDDGDAVRSIDPAACLAGRVLMARGINSDVEGPDGRVYECTVRRVVRTLARDERTPVVAGDRVLFTPLQENQGVVERVEPRTGTLSRAVRGAQHLIVANVDQLLIVASAADPPLKPGLIDRYLISATLGGVTPRICINKTDLSDAAELAAIVRVYEQLGYETLLTSAASGAGLDRLRGWLQDRASAVSGQSGVGKSSLLNSVQPGLALRTGDVSVESRKGRHTTTSARLIPLDFGGWVVDTPGIRQMELWDVADEDVRRHFADFHPHLPACRYPDCTHTHEQQCGVKTAVAAGEIAAWRYESFQRIRAGEFE